MPVLSFPHSGVPQPSGGTSYSYTQRVQDWSGLPADVTVKQCYWTFDISRQSGNVTARWYEYGNASNYGMTGMSEDGIKFVVTNVTGTSGTARIYCGAKNGWAKYNNLTFHIEYAYKQSSMTLSTSAVEAGNAITANISAQSSTATHTLTWKLGSNSQTQTLAAGVHSSSFTVPLSWLPNATSGTATCTLTTLEGGSQVGETQTLSFTVTVNAGVTPSCTVSAALVNGFAGLYLGGRSSVKLTIGNAQAGSGASIQSYKISGSGYSSTAQTATFGPLNAGTHTFTATVTDSRGRTGSATVSVTVQAYASPTLSGVSIYRSNSGGTASETGGYIALKATAAYTALNEANTVTLQGRFRPVNGAWSAWTAMTSGTRLLLGGGALSSTASYEAQIQAADTVGNTASYAAIIPTASVTFNLKAGGKGAAFGKYVEGDGLELASDWGMHRDGKSLTPAPRNLLDNSDFSNPVAQAGLNGLHGSTKYVCDRWVGHADVTAAQQAGGITLKTNQQYAYIHQRLNLQIGKTYTLVLRANNISSAHRIAVYNGALGAFVKDDFGSAETLIATFTAAYDTMAMLYYPGYSSAGGSSLLKWAALYEGSYTAETLPEYVPKGYGSELAECQRYYYKASYQYAVTPYYFATTERYYSITFPVTMRIAPSVIYSNPSGEYKGGWIQTGAVATVTASYPSHFMMFCSGGSVTDTDRPWLFMTYEASADQ